MIESALLLRAFVSLAIVIGLLLLFVWGLRRGTFRAGRLASRASIAIETAIALGERRSLVIVSVDGRRLLLGLSAGNIALLTDLTPSRSDGGTA